MCVARLVSAFTFIALIAVQASYALATDVDSTDVKSIDTNARAGDQTADGQSEQKVDALLGQLTLDEKISLLGGGGFSTKPVDRIGIPKFEMANGPQGVSKGGRGCLLPCGAALASTWDVDLASAYGTTIGMEGRARGVHFVLGPGMNICRVPVNGRNFEYFGEDPVLAGEIAAHWVAASQREGVVATIKHFAGNNQETEREGVDAQIDERTLNELYLPAFRRAVQQGGALAVMAAYNRLNGTWCAGNEILLKHYLRDSWGFSGLVMSDWGATHDTQSLAHGLDLEMGSAKYFKSGPIKVALADGTITQSDIDNAVCHLLIVA